MKNFFLSVIACIIFFSSFGIVHSSGFQSGSRDYLDTTADKATYAKVDRGDGAKTKITERVGDTISWALGIIGTLTVCFIIYGGFRWIMAKGNESQIQEAQKTIINATIGLVIVSLSYLLIQIALSFA